MNTYCGCKHKEHAWKENYSFPNPSYYEGCRLLFHKYDTWSWSGMCWDKYWVQSLGRKHILNIIVIVLFVKIWYRVFGEHTSVMSSILQDITLIHSSVGWIECLMKLVVLSVHWVLSSHPKQVELIKKRQYVLHKCM